MDWDREGQERLKGSSVLVAGLGGLGSISSQLLARAGVGRLRVVDRDLVRETDLNRQLLYSEGDLGRRKAEVAGERLRESNSSIAVEGLDVKINRSTVDDLVEGIDCVVDGLDNFETRFLINEITNQKGIPFLHGSVLSLEGRCTTFIPGETPCLSCLYPSPPEESYLPVAGPLPSLIASVQALEALKLILGLGELLRGRLMVFDGLDTTTLMIGIERRASCPVCGRRRSTY